MDKKNSPHSLLKTKWPMKRSSKTKHFNLTKTFACLWKWKSSSATLFLEDSQLNFSSQNICQIKAGRYKIHSTNPVNITIAMPWSSFIFLGLFQIYWLLTKFKLIFSGGLTSLIWILMEHPHNFLMEQFKVSQMEVRNFLASKYDYVWNYIFFFLLGLLCVTCTDMVRPSFYFLLNT